jgi:hypothetical protein
MYATYIYGTIYRLRVRGAPDDASIGSNARFGEPDVSPRIAFYPPLVGCATTSRLYFATWRLFATDDRGRTWTPTAGTTDLTRGESTRDVVSAIGVAPSDQNTVYTGSAQGRVMASRDGGATWRDVTAGLPLRHVTSIVVDRRDPGTAFLTVSGFRSGHVFRTTDFGATWRDASGPLPDIPFSACLQDPLDANAFYVGTDVGVFRTTTSGSSWESFGAGMPPAVVVAFSSHASGLVQAATYGRGAYELRQGDALPDFAVVLSTRSVSAGPGAPARVTAQIVRSNGYADPVTVRVEAVAGLKVSANAGDPAPASFQISVKAKKRTAAGTYEVPIAVTSRSGRIRSAVLEVKVP